VPLLLSHEIVSLPSASVLAVLRNREEGKKQPPKQVAVFADPVFDKQDVRALKQANGKRPGNTIPAANVRPSFLEKDLGEGELLRSIADTRDVRTEGIGMPRLPFTRREADAILAVTPPDQDLVALGFDASRSKAMSSEIAQFRVVHFATHGLLDNEHPELSGLVLSMVDERGNFKNGFLKLQDIYNLKLQADLVVLSGCETGLGKTITGEGLIGLTRGFMYAGTPRVISSLWKVDDVATSELIKHFYIALEEDKMAPAAALRSAQVALLQKKRWSSPYYWAAFLLQGEWR
jgi:CHAT domain-containing protein